MKSLPLFDPPKPRLDLDALKQKASTCTLCPLSETRNKVVFGQGNPNANMFFLGEAPGETENFNGLAFTGKAGELLSELFEVVNIDRDKVYIANTIKCRPPRNRKPYPDEFDACRWYLKEQINSVRPRIIVALGASAAGWLLGDVGGITQVRGKIWTYEDYRVMPTFHPAYLLRRTDFDPTAKEKLLKDLRYAINLM